MDGWTDGQIYTINMCIKYRLYLYKYYNFFNFFLLKLQKWFSQEQWEIFLKSLVK